MHAAIYARFSSAEQAGTTTIQSQVRACKEYAAREGWPVSPEHTYVDEAIPGSREERPAFQAMIAAAKAHKRPFERILVWKYSRFFRDREQSAIYKALLRRHGIEVISVTEPVDKDSASGVLTEGMIEVIDQFYSARLSEEVRRGHRENLMAGYRCGSIAPYGYRRVIVSTDGKRQKVRLEPDPGKSSVALRIFQSFAAGAGLKKIAMSLNADHIPGPLSATWDPSTIRSMLRNEVYLGWAVRRKTRKVLRPNGKVSYIRLPPDQQLINNRAHPAIVNRALWDSVHERFRKPRPEPLCAPNSRYLLTGFLKCGQCGGNFITWQTSWQGKAYRHYICGMRSRRGKAVCGNMAKLPHDPFERRLLTMIVEQVFTPEAMEKIAGDLNEQFEALYRRIVPEQERLRRELSAISSKCRRFVDAIGKGNFESVREALMEAECTKRHLECRIAALDLEDARAPERITGERVREVTGDIVRELSREEIPELRTALATILRTITVYPDGNLELRFVPEGLFPEVKRLHFEECAQEEIIHNASVKSLAG